MTIKHQRFTSSSSQQTVIEELKYGVIATPKDIPSWIDKAIQDRIVEWLDKYNKDFRFCCSEFMYFLTRTRDSHAVFDSKNPLMDSPNTVSIDSGFQETSEAKVRKRKVNSTDKPKRNSVSTRKRQKRNKQDVSKTQEKQICLEYTNYVIVYNCSQTKTNSIMLSDEEDMQNFHFAHCVGSVTPTTLKGSKNKPQSLYLSVLGRGGPMMLCTLDDLKNIYSDLNKITYLSNPTILNNTHEEIVKWNIE